MPEPDPKLLEAILRHCAGTAPEPWYPSEHAKANGVDRDSLDGPLEKLRLGGLVQLTEWVQGKGQGYRLTPDGTALLNDPRALGRLQGGELPQKAATVLAVPSSPGEKATTFERGEAVREAFLSPLVPHVTRVLIVVNVLMFFAQEWVEDQKKQNRPLGPFAELIVLTAGVNRQTVGLGQWWRMLTYAFFHGGTMHLVMNMYALYMLGSNAERLWGHVRFIFLYVLAALGGGCAVLLTSDVGAVGASGAICGLFAAEGVWLLLNRTFLPPPMVAAWMRNLLINGILITVISFLPGISAAGHFGGAVAGAVVSLLLHFQRFGAPLQRLTALLGLVLFGPLCTGLVYWQMQTSAAWRPFLGVMKDVDQANGLLQLATVTTRSTLKTVREDVLPTTARPPLGRNPEAVNDMLSGLAKRQGEILDLLRVTDGLGQFPDERLEAKRQRAAALLGDSVKLCRLAAVALQGGADWQAHHEALEKAADQLARLRLQ